jgi:hypothetical protein
MTPKKGFYWKQFAEVEKLFLRIIADCTKESITISQFEEKLLKHTSTRLLDWLDHFMILDSGELRNTLETLGFVERTSKGVQYYSHPGIYLPPVLLSRNSSSGETGIALRVECISDFLQANNFSADIEGSFLSPYRRAEISLENGISMCAVERRGTKVFEPVYKEEGYLKNYLATLEAWKNLPRWHNDEDLAFTEISNQVTKVIDILGKNAAAHVVCLAERDYWLSRNFAGRMQKGRHDTMGLGWANHDHHTFRSSRQHFARLINLFSQLGFDKRERFYAGTEAGWGAQLMENSEAGLTLFLDVDLAPDEVNIDFTTTALKERDTLGTVGLWCGLHGDSILKGGMHHLAALFEFDRLITDISALNVEYMAPFSDFVYLKQAFSTAERWKVSPARIKDLLDTNRITAKQADVFFNQGSVGSHLENIQRREGYKGFNKKNVSAIIREIDPRTQQ